MIIVLFFGFNIEIFTEKHDYCYGFIKLLSFHLVFLRTSVLEYLGILR